MRFQQGLSRTGRRVAIMMRCGTLRERKLVRALQRQQRRLCTRFRSANTSPWFASNIVISRIFSAYFWRLPLISAANAEEESAFFGGLFGQNRLFPEGRKAILRASAAAAQVARSRPRCAAGKSLFGADRRGVRGMDSAIYSLSQQKASAGNGHVKASPRSYAAWLTCHGE